MIVAIPFCKADAAAALTLLEWITQLGGGAGHDCLLVADAAVDWPMAVELMNAAQKSFHRVDTVCTESPVPGWPAGPNALFLEAARFAKSVDKPFLWLEPDAIPIKAGWLERLAGDYKVRGTPYMGHIYKPEDMRFPPFVMSGIAIYPADTLIAMEPLMGAFPDMAWDIAGTPVMVGNGQHTPLIQHRWGKKGLAPTFAPARTTDSPVNTLTLEDIHKETAIFHRNKDGTLLNLLRHQVAPAGTEGTKLIVVLPVCNTDGRLMAKNLEWMLSMGMPKTHDCLVSADRVTTAALLRSVVNLAKRQFNKVFETVYAMPRKTAFPQTAAWQHAARTMVGYGRPWLWLEADCIPLKANWLLTMQNEYDRCGKPFCGPVMPVRNHMNGTAIYPANTPKRLPRTMSHTNNAWDCEAKEEIGSAVHDCTRLWQCAWGVVRGQLNPIEGEELPGFPRGSAIINQIRPDAVLFHRDKSGTLIDRLRERLKTP